MVQLAIFPPNSSNHGAGDFTSLFDSGHLILKLPEHVVYASDGVAVTVAASNFTNFVFPFENHDHVGSVLWVRDHWHYSVYFSILYVTAIYAGQWLMKEREPFQLKKALTLWNISLALFSSLGLVRLLQDQGNQWALLSKDVGGGLGSGVVRSICHADHTSVVAFFWGFAFMLSKVPELGDTGFIVLRKGKLIFLHWYHHITVMMYCWYSYPFLDPCSRWFTTMNYFVHSVMYSYYALKALGVKVPRGAAMTITVLQIVQMFVGLFLNVYTFYIIKVAGEDCRRPVGSLYAGLAMYLSYLLLFINFFLKAYCVKSERRGKDKIKPD